MAKQTEPVDLKIEKSKNVKVHFVWDNTEELKLKKKWYLPEESEILEKKLKKNRKKILPKF